MLALTGTVKAIRFAAPWLVLMASLYGCAGAPIDQIDLMPAPDVYGDGLLNPLPEHNPFETLPYDGILFATDREPASVEDPEKYYLNDRGGVVRVGFAQVQLGEDTVDWEMARRISLLKSRPGNYPVKISGVEEWGVLGSTVPSWVDLRLMSDGERPPDATSRFARAINAQLANSTKKHVYIYVHGYKVSYENPVLVSTELWHFLGYNGAFIAYSWPSTPSKFAYIKDSDTSSGYSRNFRLLLKFVAEHTDAEQIHVIGYSNGTRLVTRAMEQLALLHQAETAEEIHEKVRLGNVILVGSDLDRGVFGSYIADGLLKVSRHLSIYMSQHDRALGISQFLTRRQRLGQMWGGEGGEMHPQARHALASLRNQISFINVSDAEGVETGNGHGYFRSSPWVSSDVLMTLYYGLTPEQRGLVKNGDLPVFSFPPDYIPRLWRAIEVVDPEFSRNYRASKPARARGEEVLSR